MPGYSRPTREDDPVHTVRTIARLAQMLIELRDEYDREGRVDNLEQIERRLDEMLALRAQLRERRVAYEQQIGTTYDDDR